MATDRLLSTQATPQDETLNWALRPTDLSQYVGQAELIERISIAVQASKARGEPLEHVLLHGPDWARRRSRTCWRRRWGRR